jgi:hypothetical protein
MTRRAAFLLASAITTTVHAEQMQVGFLWHMHQPTYYPGENIIQTEAAHHFSYSIVDIHNQRFGPYTTWPRDAIQAGLNLPNLGAQVSFSGSLMENLNVLQANNVNGGMWNNWTAGYKQARAWNTQQNNPRLDLVGFGYEHPLMPLLDTRDMRMQIQLHRVMTQQTFGSNVPYSTGFFPAETAFSERMIPALVAEGDFRVESGYRAGLDLLKQRPDAVFVANYLMTVGFMEALRQYRLRCPEDVALVTCDDYPWMDSFSPRLTTIDLPKRDLGAAAAQLLVERIATKGGRPRTIKLKNAMRVRESCGCRLRGAALAR